MIVHSVKNLIRTRDLLAQLKMAGIMKHEGRLIFYNAGIETGLFRLLVRTSTLDELARESGITNRQLLQSLLELGLSLGEVSLRKNSYRAKGAMAKALARNLPLAELIRETVRYHGDVACRLSGYLLNGEKGEYLKEFGGVIAESSRLTEPLIRAFIYHTVRKSVPLSILEFGCGAGEYLKYYVDINRNNGGLAIDIDASAVEIARRRIRENGIEGNFTVHRDSILNAESLRGKSFDLVTSYSNIYYFSDDERMRLFETVRKLLRSNGRFMLATAMKNGTLSSSYYDLIFSATRGLYPLPRKNNIVTELKRSGFARVKTVNLLGRSFTGIVAHA
ncbi:MAG: class I SAM-dependent methyltransferase [Spirochaetes bacterium]|nr:class I SAM-dependent methyltransferase [Spirochaetota bacterium]